MKVTAMPLRLGINGFGRIGRTILRSLILSGRKDVKVVAINDPAPSETLVHLFEYDSLHGRLSQPVRFADDMLQVAETSIRLTRVQNPKDLPWADVDVALECSGQFTQTQDVLRHLQNGSTRVLLSAPAKGNVKGDAKTVVYGVNHMSLTSADKLVSNASCTTNCLVPVAKVLDDAFGIEQGMMTTVHSYTSTQPTHDTPHDDLYRARAAGLSMIPTSTGAADTLGDVMPHLAGRITGHAIRVPTPNVSCIDLVVTLKNSVSAADINTAFKTAADGPFAGILGYTDRKLVSMDFRQNPHSATVAIDQTRVQGAHLARVFAWYDNEWGFAHRMIDTAQYMHSNT